MSRVRPKAAMVPRRIPAIASLMPDHTTSLRIAGSTATERHADAHLLVTLRDGIGHQTVYSYRRENQRDCPKDRQKQHVEALAGRRTPP